MHFHDFPQFKKQHYDNTNNSALQDFSASLHEFYAKRVMQDKNVQYNFLTIFICCYIFLLFFAKRSTKLNFFNEQHAADRLSMHFGNLYCPINCVNCAAHAEIRLGQVACNKRKMRKQRCTGEELAALRFRARFTLKTLGVFQRAILKGSCCRIVVIVLANSKIVR